MSIQLMTLAWKSDFATGPKMVLLALCDNANDQGECYPSIPMLAEKCSIGRATIFEHLDKLEKSGCITKHTRSGRSTIYKVDPSRFQTRPESRPVQISDSARPDFGRSPVQISDSTRPESGHITIKEPSIESSIESKATRKNKKQIVVESQQTNFELPDWIDKKHWAAWHMHPKRQKLKAEQMQLAVDQLAAWRDAGVDHALALKNSATNGWQGLFEPQEKKGVRRHDPTEPAWRREQRERTANAVPGIAEKSSFSSKVTPIFIDTESKNVAAIAVG